MEYGLVSSHGLELLVLVLQLLLQFGTFGLPFFGCSLGGEEGSRRGRCCCCGGSHSSERRGCGGDVDFLCKALTKGWIGVETTT